MEVYEGVKRREGRGGEAKMGGDHDEYKRERDDWDLQWFCKC
jgi:hypothetical protein